MKSELWNNNFFESKEQFFNFEKNGQPILMQLNYVAILMSALKLFSVIITGHIVLNSFWPLFVYALPLILCISVHIIILKKAFNISFFLAFYCVPISVILLGRYEQMTFLIIYQIAYGVVAFFILQKRRMIVSSYIFSALAILLLGVNEIYSTGNTSSYHILFLFFNFFIFFIPFYFILGYLRRIIEHSQQSIKDKRNRLAIQNEILEKLNRELTEQEYLLAIKHQSLAESTDFQKKIIAILSHDIRVPLVSIKNLLGAYSKKNISKEKILKYLPDIEENIQYLTGLFEDMLSWSKEQRIHPELQKKYLNLKSISQEICHSYVGTANSKKIKLHNKINESKLVYGNERYVKAILRNLISNAIKFTDTNGEVTIDSKRNDFFDIISVQDTGQGISEENLEKIRKGLEITTKGTLNETGTGLGLYFCRDFAIKSGGTLFVESKLGKGSIFSFTLPTLHNQQVMQKAG